MGEARWVGRDGAHLLNGGICHLGGVQLLAWWSKAEASEAQRDADSADSRALRQNLPGIHAAKALLSGSEGCPAQAGGWLSVSTGP